MNIDEIAKNLESH